MEVQSSHLLMMELHGNILEIISQVSMTVHQQLIQILHSINLEFLTVQQCQMAAALQIRVIHSLESVAISRIWQEMM